MSSEWTLDEGIEASINKGPHSLRPLAKRCFELPY